MTAVRTPLTRAVVAFFAFVAMIVGLAACGGGHGDNSKDAAPKSDFQPVTITHALGSAEIKEKPTRVVTLGQGSAETAIALGVIPVAMEPYPWGADESGYRPWVKEALEEKGEALPPLLKGTGEDVSAEEVLSYNPDLILAPWSGITEEQYKQLSAIAPTVAYPEQPWTIEWDQQIRTVSEALGYKDKAEDIIQGIDAAFKDAQKPEYKNTTFSFIYNQGPESLGIFMPTEQRAAVVGKLGLTIDPVVDEFSSQVTEGTDSAPLSLENLDKLKNSDLIFTFYRDDANRAEMHGNSLYASIPAIKRGSEVAPTDQSLVTASSMINPLSVPWMLKRYTALIDEAIAKL